MLKIFNFEGKTYYLDDAVNVGQKPQELQAIPRIYKGRKAIQNRGLL